MKKLLMILFVGLFLIGCQSNDRPEDEQVEPDNGEEQVDEVEETDEADQDDIEDENLPEADGDSDDTPVDEDETPDSETPKEDEEDAGQNDSGARSYSSDEAIVLVQEFIQGTGADIGLNYSFDGTDDQGNYRIQVFEVVDHGEGESHTATYGWYLVNPETGEITDLFAQ